VLHQSGTATGDPAGPDLRAVPLTKQDAAGVPDKAAMFFHTIRRAARLLLPILLALLAPAAPAVAAVAAPATAPLLLDAASSGAYLNPAVDYFVDASGQMTVEQVAASAGFVASGGRMGLANGNHPLWLRVSLRRTADAPSAWYAEFLPLNPAVVHFYAPDGRGGVAPQKTEESRPGAPQPFSHRKHLYRIELPQEGSTTLYLRAAGGSGSYAIPLRIWQFDHWADRSALGWLAGGVCVGIMVGLALYNLLLFARLRDGFFLLYSGVVCSHLLFALATSSAGRQLEWPAWFVAIPFRPTLLGSAWAILAILFAQRLFDGPDLNPWVRRLLHAAVGAYAATIGAVLLGDTRFILQVMIFAPMLWIPLILGLALWRAAQGSLSAVYYLLGHGPVLVSVALIVNMFRGAVPATSLVAGSMLLAGAWEAILFSQALAERINALKREREAAQQDSRAAAAALTEIAHRRAYVDELTRLANRERLRQDGDALLEIGVEPLVMVFNIDRFKEINNALGYGVGDAVLVETARRFGAIAEITPGRLHSNLFCALSVGGRVDALRERIGAAFAEPLLVEGHPIDVDLSVGLCLPSGTGGDMALRMRNAEIALHAGRRNGANWSAYAPGMEALRRADLALQSALRRAAEQGELRLHLQPKVRLADGRCECAEALLRWQHPQRGMVPPVQFIPFAEQTMCIRVLTGWVLRRAMELTCAWRAAGAPLQVSVNLSMHDLRDARFVEQARELLGATGADPRDIRLEVTESVAMDNPTDMLAVMRALRAAGFSLSMDDFGTGYSSLAYLQKMPVAELKIDRSFVAGTLAGSEEEALLDSIVALGHRLGLAVVAEGAETAAEWRLLRAMGCDMVQGWVAARAMPEAEFALWRAAHDGGALVARLGAPAGDVAGVLLPC